VNSTHIQPFVDKYRQPASDQGVFELATPEPVWIWVLTCPKPLCPCRSALVMATRQGHDVLLRHGTPVHAAWTAGADYTRLAVNLEELLVFCIDIDLAEASPPYGEASFAPGEHPDIDTIVAQMDGELLDAMGSLWYRGKDRPDPVEVAQLNMTPRIPGWKRGNMLAWGDACTGLREDVYGLHGKYYAAEEFYCPVPECACGEVLISFDGPPPAGIPEGHITVGRTGDCRLESTQLDSSKLELLWDAFQKRHPHYRDRFARRIVIMKEIGARLERVVQPATSTKFGRNDPCPCGSGKKYKKCCAL